MSDCPLRADREMTECCPSCAWRIGDDCAMVVLAKMARHIACNTCEASENSNHPWCVECSAREPRP